MSRILMWLLLLLGSIGFVLAPVATLVCVCLLATILPGQGARWLFIIAACLLFVLLNLAKEVEGDLITYADIQHAIAGQPLDILLRVDELRRVSGTYRLTELGFYGGLWALASVLGDTGIVIPVASSLAIYLCIAGGVLIWGRCSGWNQRLTLVVLVVYCFAALNFVQTTHLLRQYIAGSMAFLALCVLADGRWKTAALLALAACSVHNGTVLVVASVVLVHVLFPAQPPRPRRWLAIAWRVLLVAAASAALMVYLGLRDLRSLGRAEGNLTLWHFLFAGGLLAGYLYARRFGGPRPPTARLLLLAYCAILLISAGYFVTGFNLLALRYFAYLEWLYALLVAELLCMVPRKSVGLYLSSRWAACAAATCVLILRVNAAEWTYGPGRADIFLASAPVVAGFVSR